jgi:hypothetical protein
MGVGMSASPIDEYLDELMLRLRGEPSDIRRVLAETEDHLRTAAAEAVASGLDEKSAERRAVERFGPPRLIARRFGAEWTDADASSVIRQAMTAVTAVAMVGMLAIGMSGAVAAGMGALWGKSFVAGDADGVTYTASRCADFLEYFPHAGSCTAAAVDHHFDEIVSYRLAVGVLGLAALAVLVVLHRRRRRTGPTLRLLPRAFVPTIGAAVFGMAAIILGFGGLNLLLQGTTHGAGGQFSAAIVSCAVAVAFGWRLLRELSTRADLQPRATAS